MRNVLYAYDLFGNLNEARFSSLAGPGFSYRHDGLGRMIGIELQGQYT